MNTKYILGFAFDKARNNVVLIEKQKPNWQKGLLNGIGGKVEPGELDVMAMVREFGEETGLNTNADDWELICEMYGDGWMVVVFGMCNNRISECRTMEVEEVKIFHVADVPFAKCVANLTWLIPMAMSDENTFASIKYH